MGQGPFSVRREAEAARRADRGEARERFYPASELSGEIKLLLLLCDVFRSCSRELSVFLASNEPSLVCVSRFRTPSTLRMGLLLYAKGVTDRWQRREGYKCKK